VPRTVRRALDVIPRRAGRLSLPVLHLHQTQSLRRGGGAGQATALGAEDFAGPGFGSLAAADLDQRADDDATHVVEEAVGFDFDGDEVFGSLEGDNPIFIG